MRKVLNRQTVTLWLMSFFAAFTFIQEATARSSICANLDRQLTSSGTVSSRGSDKFAKSARAQMQQLQIARGQARQAGCGGLVTLFGGKNSTACTRITSTIRRMESNLTVLQNKAGGNATASRPNRSRILAALAANDCNKVLPIERLAKRKPVTPETQLPSLFTTIFGGETVVKKVVSYSVLKETKPTTKKQVTVINGGKPSVSQYDAAGGTFRTMCVRTCDGYYFPVSFSTTSSHFPKDEKACAAMCPGAETMLYHHSVPDQEPEEMISLRDEPYAKSATAFNYRRDGIGANAACTCQAAPKTEAELESDVKSGQTAKWVPYPTSKPSPFDDEEARLNRVGSLDAKAIHELLKPKLGNDTLAAQQNVRVVGPAFLPSQSGATGLQVLGRSRVQ